jgi:hypothetical protein
MANRTRPIRIEFCVSDYEHRLIKNKMAQLPTSITSADASIRPVTFTQRMWLI